MLEELGHHATEDTHCSWEESESFTTDSPALLRSHTRTVSSAWPDSNRLRT